jgi:hypothetical protein
MLPKWSSICGVSPGKKNMAKNKIVSRPVVFPLIMALAFFALATILAAFEPKCDCFYGRWGVYVAYILAEVVIIKIIVINFIIEKLNIKHKNFVLWVLAFVVFILYLVFFSVIIGLGEKNAWGGPY